MGDDLTVSVHMELEFSNIEAEKQVIGSLLLNPKLIEEVILQPGQFYDNKHNNILYIMKKLHEKNVTPEPISIVEYAAKINKVEKVGGISYITELAASIPSTSNFNHYQSVIIEKFQKKKMYEVTQEVLNDILNLSPQEAKQKLLNELEVLELASSTKSSIKTIGEVMTEVFQDANIEKGLRSGVDTGFIDFNKIIGGYQKSDFVIVGARPSAGKTAFLLNSAVAVASEEKGTSLIFSAEMPNLLIGKRMVSSAANIQGHKMRNPMRDFTEKDWDNMMMGIGELSDKPIYFCDEPTINLDIIKRNVREVYKKEEGKHLVVFIDYLQIIQMDKKFGADSNKGIGYICKQLKALARELDITIVMLSQLSRKVEQREDKRPMMSDIRDSGEVEQVADIITFLYREDYYDRETENKNIVELIIGKHRNGEVGTVKLGFRKDFSKFLNIFS